MRIGIDARFTRSSGVERYYNELIRNLSLIDEHNQYIIYYPSTDYMKRHRIEQANFISMVLPAPVFSIAEQPLLTYRLLKDRVDVFHATNYWVVPLVSPCAIVTTAHDMCAKAQPELISSKARVYARLMLPYALRKACRIFTVSEFSKSEIVRYYKGAEDKIVVAYNGIDERFSPVSDQSIIHDVKKKYHIRGEYFLYVGSVMRHKNIFRLIDAYKMLSPGIKKRYSLLLVARMVPGHEDIYKAAMKLSKGENIFYIQDAEDKELPALYSCSTAFIFPSLYEGFGIPLAEAMACGTPVLAARQSSTPEICGEAAYYFDPFSAVDIKSAIERLLEDISLAERLSVEGVKRAAIFSWKITAKKALSVYEEAYSQREKR